MTGEEGTTLAEMLAALLVISLTIGGLGQGLNVINRFQAATALRAVRTDVRFKVQDELGRLFGSAPDAGVLVGAGDQLSLQCGVGRVCHMTLTNQRHDAVLIYENGSDRGAIGLPQEAGAHFSFQADDGLHTTWPPSEASTRLRGIAIQDSAETVLAYVHVREQQPFRCEFDLLVNACRKAAE